VLEFHSSLEEDSEMKTPESTYGGPMARELYIKVRNQLIEQTKRFFQRHYSNYDKLSPSDMSLNLP